VNNILLKMVFKVDKRTVERVVSYLCGEDTLPIVEYLKGKENISEFKIAEDLKIDMNLLRNQLYRLQKQNLLYFRRKKDKKKGWYIYYWTLNLSEIPFLLKKIKEDELRRLKSRLERERSNRFYVCKNRCMRLSFEQAMDFNFICPECGSIMNEEDNSKIIEELEMKIKKLEEEIKKIDEKYFLNKKIKNKK